VVATEGVIDRSNDMQQCDMPLLALTSFDTQALVLCAPELQEYTVDAIAEHR